MPEVDIVCLANSRKMAGRCVAGWRLDGGGWFRPVSELPDGTLYSNFYVHDGGQEAALLDVLRIPYVRPQPDLHQPENHLIHPLPWRLVSRIPVAEVGELLAPALAPGPELLGNTRDRVPYATFRREPATSSLALIEPDWLQWRVTTSYRGNRQVRARFALRGLTYDLPVTDPAFEQRMATLPVGAHGRAAVGIGRTDRVLLTVSLGEPFPPTEHGDCFKLVAAVLVLPSDGSHSVRTRP